MKIGVICEGPTDFLAIQYFFEHALREAGIQAKFTSIQPQMDKTQPEAGWGNVLLWFAKNPANYRVQKFFGGGLFGGSLSTDALDAFLIQLDSDILGTPDFTDYVQKTYNISLNNPLQEAERADEIRTLIESAAEFSKMTKSDIGKHVIAAAVESTEAWCVAAFANPTPNCEILSGQDLANAFMNSLERSEGRAPREVYENIDKSASRRKRFCERHAAGSSRIRNGCKQFDLAFEQLKSLT